MRGRYAALTVLALAAGLGAGVGIERERSSGAATSDESGAEILYWVAPMDPNFRKDAPGKSPMGMDLIPVYEGNGPATDPAEVRLSAAEVNVIGVRSAVARVEDVAQRVETVGVVAYDEHATSHVHTRVEGWIERLAVRAVGDPVAAGDLLFELFAPEITIASSELMRATRRQSEQEITIARTKLRNFGVSARQIEEMAQADIPAQRIRYYAPQDGVVIALAGADGMFLRPETRALSLGDLSSVWLIVDVFERDMGRITPDMRAEARIEHLPGRVFSGEIDYIFPELDPETRTLKLRLRFDNTEELLRPNMFANVVLIPGQARAALTVPSEAVIRTGRAERVILRGPEGTFRPRLVTTGLRGGFGEGQRTEIVQGLEPGEEVVASAQFLIDSESALNAGMMRFAPTDAEPAVGRGVLVSFDPETRRARIRHEAIAELDWPAMETVFTLRADVALDGLVPGDALHFEIVRGADGILAVTHLDRDDGIAATGRGVVHAVTPEGKLTMSHDPIPALGWSEMRMDFDVMGVDPATVPLEAPVSFDLAKGGGGIFVIVSLRAEDGPELEPDKPQATPAPITVTGTINGVSDGMANITHGPIAAIGMPGMTMDFALAEGLDPASLPIGRETVIEMAQGADFSLTVLGIEELGQ
jgi:membrane fusion protein, copper/silver efflux system